MLGPVSDLSSSSLSSLSAALIFYFPVNQLIFFVVILLPKQAKLTAVLIVPCDTLDETTSFMDILLGLFRALGYAPFMILKG